MREDSAPGRDGMRQGNEKPESGEAKTWRHGWTDCRSRAQAEPLARAPIDAQSHNRFAIWRSKTYEKLGKVYSGIS